MFNMDPYSWWVSITMKRQKGSENHITENPRGHKTKPTSRVHSWIYIFKKDVLFIIGGWNATVGSQKIPGLTGNFGLGVWNEAGQRLTEFCQENALVTANTLFQQRKRQLYTWTSPDGQYQNQTDYILCSQILRSSKQSAKARPGADCGSDHELFIAKFRLKLKKAGKTTRVWSKSNPLWLYSGSDK